MRFDSKIKILSKSHICEVCQNYICDICDSHLYSRSLMYISVVFSLSFDFFVFHFVHLINLHTIEVRYITMCDFNFVF